jgi:peptide/nickel transport system substrate-binding protein
MKSIRDGKVHPYVPELYNQFLKGEVDRREFLRTSTLLGVSAAAAYAMVGQVTGESFVSQAQAATPKMGGILRSSMRVQEMVDPATFSWTQMSNQARGFLEYLTHTGTDNVTRPYLAEKWEASDDLKTWTMHLRKGVKWSNGDDFGADDVVYNIERWLDEATGSSNIGLFAAMTEAYDTGKKKDGKAVMGKKMLANSVEKVDANTVRLNLSRPVLAIPENLYNYPTAIVHRKFGDMGGDLSKNPIGTGPFEMTEYKVGEKFSLRKRAGYWGREAYLDGVDYFDHGDDPSAMLNALISGQVDHAYEVAITQIDIIDKVPNLELLQTVTAQTGIARMQMDQKPFDDIRVRQAIQACIDHEALLNTAYRGRGAAGEDHHVSPIHPEYYALPKQKVDIAKAKRLLAEAGHKDGLTIKIDFGQADAWHAAAVQAMKQQLAPAGINMELNPMPGSSYWDVWDKTPMGFTSWTHRPLGVMVLDLAYRTGVPWNESHYSNPEFDKALDDAGATLDVNERRKKMAKVQGILQNDAIMVQPLWRAVFEATNKKVQGHKVHPTQYHQFQNVWLA